MCCHATASLCCTRKGLYVSKVALTRFCYLDIMDHHTKWQISIRATNVKLVEVRLECSLSILINYVTVLQECYVVIFFRLPLGTEAVLKVSG